MRRTVHGAERNRQNAILLRAFVLLFAAAIACHFAGGETAAIGVPAAGIAWLLLIVAFRTGRAGTKMPSAADTEEQQLLPQLAEEQVDASIADFQISHLGPAYRKEQWAYAEKDVDALLDSCINLIRLRIEANTIAVFFAAGGDEYRLRRYWSAGSLITPDAVISPGRGVLGGMFKDGLKAISLGEIMSDSTTLFYYDGDAGVRSLIACPIVAGSADCGIIIADSTKTRAFTDDHMSFLSTVAALAGQAANHAYRSTAHSLEHLRLSAVSNIEKNFFSHLTIDEILDMLAQIIPIALQCDRMTISMRSDDGESAVIRRAFGSDVAGLPGTKFSLSDKSLASVLYGNNLCFSRNFASDRYEVRYFEKEPRKQEYGSFLAVPLGVDECKGMILIESVRPDAFSNAVRDMLSRIATSAGLALAKILLLEKANAMATRDGLTGLFNHRQFQQLLRDEIIRSGRYNDPLALVLCDIDFFKKINDTWGHPFGDAVLKNVAGALETGLRKGVDTAARYGGEEFALILVKSGEQEAIDTAERIRAVIERTPLRSSSGSNVHVTMSFGIAVLGTHARAHDELIKKADKALYRAKEKGRNRVEVF